MSDRRLEQTLVPLLRPTAVVLALIYTGYTVADLALAHGPAGLLTVSCAGTALVMAAVALALPRELAPAVVHPVIAGYGVLLVANALTHLVVQQETWQTSYVMLVVVGLGAFMVDTRWFAGAAGLLLVAWAAARISIGELGEPVMFEVGGVLTAIVLATVVHLGRRGALLALLHARDAAEAAAVEDPLTGLVNRRGLFLLGSQVVEAARRQGDAVHAVFLDVDGLKRVNDLAGHQAGDEVLVLVADVLRSVTRATDVVARWGGDEFCVVGPGPGISATEIERRVRSSASAAGQLPSQVWVPQVSAGGAVLAPWDDGDLAVLLANADREMYLRRCARRQVPQPESFDRRRPAPDPLPQTPPSGPAPEQASEE